MNASISDDNWGHSTVVFFIVVTLITDILFGQFLIHTGVNIADREP